MSKYKIPFFGLNRQYANIRDEILARTDDVYKTGKVLGGDFTSLFELMMAKRCNREHAITVNSCTQALIFAFQSHDQGWYNKNTSKQILVPGISYIATLNAIIMAGYEPVFCDVDRNTGLIDINSIPVPMQDLCGMVYVNLFGNVANWDAIERVRELFQSRRDFFIIEDAAQSFGSSWKGIPSGKLGDVSCLSFDPTKNLNNYGSGGMLLTDNYDLVEYFRDLKDNGKHHDNTMPGTNSKMNEADCAQMIVKLRHFDEWQTRRQEIAEYYTEQLQDYVLTPNHEPEVTHSWSKYVIHHHDRSIIHTALNQAGVETKIHYPRPLHLESIAFSHALTTNQVLPGAEDFCGTSLSLPIYPELTDSEVETVCDLVKQYT